MNPVTTKFDAAVAAIERIDRMADGHPLTKPQSADRARYLNEAVQLITAEELAEREGTFAGLALEKAANASEPEDATRWLKTAAKALRAQEYARESAVARGEYGERVERPLSNQYAKSAVVDALREHVRTGSPQVVDYAANWTGPEWRVGETRALQSEGGSAVPVSFSDAFATVQRTMSPMMDGSIVRLIETASGNSLVVPRLTADPNHGGTVTAQAAGINELDATVSSITLGAFKYGITQLYSYELAQDETIDLERRLGESAARELSIDIGSHLTTGTGTTQPFGIVSQASNGGTAGGTATGTSSDTFFSPADILDLWYSLPAPYRKAPGAGLMVSTTALAKIRKFRDSNGQFLWSPNLGGNETFAGIPVIENPAMAAVASASKSVLAGDLGSYYTRVVPLRVEISKDYKFNTDQIALRSIFRVDGNLPDVAAVRFLVSANS